MKVTTTGTKPHKDERKMIRGVLHERVWFFSGGLPILKWIPVVDDESPGEYPLGYMQQRGAA